MIAADTSTWIAYLQGGHGKDVELLDMALKESAPEASKLVEALPVLEVTTGYWLRAGALRAKVLKMGRRARLGDALIAQSCVDHGVHLLTRDRDFRGFALAAGLDVAVEID